MEENHRETETRREFVWALRARFLNSVSSVSLWFNPVNRDCP